MLIQAKVQTQKFQKEKKRKIFNFISAVSISLGTFALCSALSQNFMIGKLSSTAFAQPENAVNSEPCNNAPSQKRTDFGIFIIGGLRNNESHFLSYIETLKAQFENVRFEPSGKSMMNPDHIKEYHEMESAITNMAKEGNQKIVVIGFSMGGKHAARLAMEHSEVAGLVLLDPVDGGPQPNGKTPIFLKDGDRISKPTLLLASEFGAIPKLMGQACAPEEFAHKHFRTHIEGSSLFADEVIPGTGHINFLTKPWDYFFALACDNGTADYLDTQKYILSKITDFLGSLR